MKLLHEPLVHFMFIGALIYASYGLLATPENNENENIIVVSAGELDWMKSSWEKRWNRPPTKQELNNIIDQYVRDTILYKEALNMGLDQNDTVIKKRLAQKVEYIAKDLVTYVDPTEQELQAYLLENIDDFRKPATYTFSQVFVDPDKRGENTLVDAEKIKETLINEDVAIDDVDSYSDELMTSNYFENTSTIDIRRAFGTGFTDSLVSLEKRTWHGPILSGFGVHIVYVEEVIPSPIPKLTDVKQAVTQDWYDQKREELNEEFYIALKERYQIIIDDKNSSSKFNPTNRSVATVQNSKLTAVEPAS